MYHIHNHGTFSRHATGHSYKGTGSFLLFFRNRHCLHAHKRLPCNKFHSMSMILLFSDSQTSFTPLSLFDNLDPLNRTLYSWLVQQCTAASMEPKNAMAQKLWHLLKRQWTQSTRNMYKSHHPNASIEHVVICRYKHSNNSKLHLQKMMAS